MSGSGQDNSPGAGPKYPGVRLRGSPKKPGEKAADPPSSKPIIPPATPKGPEVRLRRPSGAPPVKEVTPLPVVVPEAQTPVPEVAAPETGSTFESAAVQEYSAEQPVEPYTEPYQEYSVEQSGQTYAEPVPEYSTEQSPPPYAEPYQEYTADQSSSPYVENAQTAAVDPVEAAPDPSAASKPKIGAIRLRGNPKATAAASAPASAAPSGVPDAPSHFAPVEPAASGLPYTPDTDYDRVCRRQWWKYDLRVKSNREQPQEQKKL